jgi:hypothetical protein
VRSLWREILPVRPQRPAVGQAAKQTHING